MKGVNVVIVEEKYFWKMYESSSSTKNSVVLDKELPGQTVFRTRTPSPLTSSQMIPKDLVR